MTRIARRGGDTPLGIAEALREGLESGDLAWTRDSVFPRSRRTVQRDTRSASHWMFRRLRFVPAGARAVLDGLAVLGGEADLAALGKLVESVDVEVDLPAACGLLEQGCWIETTGKELVTLTTATLHDLLQGVMAPDRLAAWHGAAARLLSDSGSPLAAGSAALHALYGAEIDTAQKLARRAAASARAAGLVETAHALEGFAEGRNVARLTERSLTGGKALDELVAPETLRRGRVSARASSQPAEVVSAFGTDTEEAATSKVMVALREGNFDEVERLTMQLREGRDNELLADRLDAMACIARGEAGDALRLLRKSKDRAQELGPAERCRAALAHGVGLAAAGRTTDALLEALDGLARAREAQDTRGEQACARLLAQLTSGAGRADAAAVWASLASS